MMAAKLASYQPYVSANLTAEEAERYECFDMQALWKNFKGPCALETQPCRAPAWSQRFFSMKHFNV